ncbi:MAG: hypothetical protein ACOYJI_03250 [Anaerovoracaceae bacterium]|jgi:hypothetical protein
MTMSGNNHPIHTSGNNHPIHTSGNNNSIHTKKARRLFAGCLVFLMVLSSLLTLTGCSKYDIRSKDAKAMVDELRQEGYVPDDWVYIDCSFPGGGLFDYSKVILAYIDRDLYDSHKSYWLEGVDEEDLYPGFGPEEPEKVFHLVRIDSLDDGTYKMIVYMTGTYYKYVDRTQANYHKEGTEYTVYRKMEPEGSLPVAHFRIKKKFFGGYSAALMYGQNEDDAVSEESVKETMHDKKWTENYYDINPRGTGKEIAAAMQQQGMIPADTRLVYTDGEKNIYIPSDLYDSYKSYWLEGTNEEDLYEGINQELRENGDHVFWEIEVTGISYYSKQKEKYGITFKPDTSYYCAVIYQDCLFYKTILHYSWEGYHQFTWKDVEPVTDGDSSSEDIMSMYWCHYEDGELVIEKATEE